MKRLTLLLAMAIICLTVSAQDEGKKSDTIRIGGMIIVKKGWISKKNRKAHMEKEHLPKKVSNISTNWWILDLGFSNYDDKTNYSSTGSYLVNRPGYPALSRSDFKLRTGKSVNVNIWLFMQKLNLVKHYVNLKYGLGIELNNYRYKSTAALSYKEGGVIPYSTGLQTNSPFIFRDSISFSKNKLAADYLTVPLMLNFTSNPDNSKKAVSLSLGISGGYLYSQRNKQKSSERGKWKNKGDYNLERFKLSYVAEFGIGQFRVYGSYSPKSMYKKSLDMRPYNFGLRFSNW